jgi:hypothetical protein
MQERHEFVHHWNTQPATIHAQRYVDRGPTGAGRIRGNRSSLQKAGPYREVALHEGEGGRNDEHRRQRSALER